MLSGWRESGGGSVRARPTGDTSLPDSHAKKYSLYGLSLPTRAFSVPLMARPVGTISVAITRSRFSSLATIRRAPERGLFVVSRDQNVTAVGLGSPEATPS